MEYGYDSGGSFVVLKLGPTGSDPKDWDWATLLDEPEVELVAVGYRPAEVSYCHRHGCPGHVPAPEVAR